MGRVEHLLVADLKRVSLKKLVRDKLQVFFDQQQAARVDLKNLHSVVMQEVEQPLIDLALSACRGSQIRAAQMLGMNRNTLRKKIHDYKIKYKKPSRTTRVH